MLERDFLMRQLLQLFEVLQSILRRRKKGEIAQAQDEVTYFYSILKLEEDAWALSIEQFYHLLADEKKLTNDQLEMVAYVLKEQGEMAGEEQIRLDFFRKAYFLLEKAERESITFSLERLMKLEELKERLN